MRTLFRNPIALIILVIILLVLVGSTVVIVPETKQAVVTRFGQPEQVINRYENGQEFGDYGAGIAFRIPFVDHVEWVDKRIQVVSVEDQPVLSTDQLRLNVDAYARFRVIDPLQMYISARTEDTLNQALKQNLASALRNELGRREFAALLSPERGQMMENIRAALDRVARQYGTAIVDVRIRRADLPNGTPLEAAYNRMKSARQQQARSIEAEGLKQAQIIRATAEAEAAAIFARAFNQDPAFYNFYRAMQSYRQAFLSNPQAGTNMILSPDNEYLRQFREGGR